MEQAQRDRIALAAYVAHEKRMAYECLAMMNTPSDPEDRKKSFAELSIAKAEMLEANWLLEQEQKPVAGCVSLR